MRLGRQGVSPAATRKLHNGLPCPVYPQRGAARGFRRVAYNEHYAEELPTLRPMRPNQVV